MSVANWSLSKASSHFGGLRKVTELAASVAQGMLGKTVGHLRVACAEKVGVGVP